MENRGRQENTARRARVEDADYVLSAEEPNLPRVREEAAAINPVPVIIAMCAVILAVTALFSFANRVGGAGLPTEAEAAFLPRRADAFNTPFGIDVEDVSAPVAAYYRFKGRDTVTGVGAFEVDPDGPAAALCRGDVITAVNGERVSSAEELIRLWESADLPPVLTVYRDGAYTEAETAPAG